MRDLLHPFLRWRYISLLVGKQGGPSSRTYEVLQRLPTSTLYGMYRRSQAYGIVDGS